MATANSPTEWTFNGLLDEIRKLHATMQDRALAFVLGSGASVSSGIPTGKAMAESWLKELHLRECHNGASLEDWVASGALGIEGLVWERAAEHYPRIFERRFRGDPESGFASLETAMDGKEPSIGYSLLAEIMQNTRHKVVVTTNFDNLVADALAIHAHKPPLIVGHESLTGYVRALLRRPLVAKIHRDLYLNPKNDTAGVEKLGRGWQEALNRLFKHYTPVVIGYGGNDGSLMGFLNNLEPGDISGRIFWCYHAGSPPSQAVRDLLVKLDGVLVAVHGFDELMLSLANVLVEGFSITDINKRIEERGKDRAKNYREQAEKLQKNLAAAPAPSADQQAAKEAMSEALEDENDWWTWEMRASAETEPEKQDRIYRDGLTACPDSSELTGNYALFLHETRKDYDAAEKIYKKALELNPEYAIATGNYALFLDEIRKNSTAAEDFYKRALALDPEDANAAGNYALFLHEARKNYDAAEEMYKKALELDPEGANAIGNYAVFLQQIRKNYVAAEAMHKKALKLAPKDANINANYAAIQLLLGHSEVAKEHAQQAVELSVHTASSVAAEALLSLALCEALEGKLPGDALGRLKSLLQIGYERSEWSFDDLFVKILPQLPAETQELYKLLGAAILDEKALPALEQNKLWQEIEARPWAE